MVCGNPANPVPRALPPPSAPSAQTPAFEIGSLDWFAAQNDNQFDPQLFGDYREPQDNILAGGLYDDTFFNEAFAMPVELVSSLFTLEAGAVATPGGKRDLVAEIDEKLKEDEEEVVPGESEMLTCTNMWYAFPPFSFLEQRLTQMSGRKSKPVPACRTARSTSTVSARSCSRKQSVRATAPLSRRRTSRTC